MFVYNYARFVPKDTLDVLVRFNVTTLCAPPTVWRMLVQEPLATYAVKLREICLLYTSPSPRDRQKSRMPSSA